LLAIQAAHQFRGASGQCAISRAAWRGLPASALFQCGQDLIELLTALLPGHRRGFWFYQAHDSSLLARLSRADSFSFTCRPRLKAARRFFQLPRHKARAALVLTSSAGIPYTTAESSDSAMVWPPRFLISVNASDPS
jgi:hypothetical protein